MTTIRYIKIQGRELKKDQEKMADLDHLIQWVRKNGGFVSDKLTLKEMEIFGNCLCANQPILKGQYFKLNKLINEFQGRKLSKYHKKCSLIFYPALQILSFSTIAPSELKNLIS